MGFLGLPNKDQLASRALIFAVDTLNDSIDTESKRIKIVAMLNPLIDIPLISENEEAIVLLTALEKINDGLQKFERALRDKK